MGLAYHAQALSKDVSYKAGAVVGIRNMRVVKEAIEKLTAKGHNLADLGPSVAVLDKYFGEILRGLGEDGIKLAERQEFGDELLGGADGDALDAAELRAHSDIDASTAERHAQLIADRLGQYPEP